jgi:hypothetical protein
MELLFGSNTDVMKSLTHSLLAGLGRLAVRLCWLSQLQFQGFVKQTFSMKRHPRLDRDSDQKLSYILTKNHYDNIFFY